MINRFRWEETYEGEARIVDCLTDAVEIAAPDEINGRPVVEICPRAFFNKRVRAVSFGANMRTIRSRAFSASDLRVVAFTGEKLPEFDKNTFPCGSLRVVASPDGTLEIPGRECVKLSLDQLRSQTVDGCVLSADRKTLLCSIAPKLNRLPASVEAIAPWAFSYDKTLQKITISKKVQTIDDAAFAGSLLRVAEFEGKVENIADTAFENCTALGVIASPDASMAVPGAERLTTDALRSRTLDGVVFSADGKTLIACLESKKTYVVPPGVEIIRNRAFFASEIETIELPESLRQIDDFAFEKCASLRAVKLPAGCDVGKQAFAYCRNLKLM